MDTYNFFSRDTKNFNEATFVNEQNNKWSYIV